MSMPSGALQSARTRVETTKLYEQQGDYPAPYHPLPCHIRVMQKVIIWGSIIGGLALFSTYVICLQKITDGCRLSGAASSTMLIVGLLLFCYGFYAGMVQLTKCHNRVWCVCVPCVTYPCNTCYNENVYD